MALLATSGACVADGPEAGSAVTQALITPTGGPCPRSICGANSPVIDTFELHELSLNPGERNSEGFEIEQGRGVARIDRGGASYELRVVNGRIAGYARGRRVLSGQGLVDATIPVVRGKVRYEIAIQGVRDMTYFAEPRDPIEAYTLAWRTVGNDRPLQALCNNIDSLRKETEADVEQGQRELMGMDVVESVVFEGDRVDAYAKTMAPAADDRWFNLGCAGHTLSKLRLTHNTVHSQDPALARPWQERQATLKLLVADYCGTGTAFTVAGQPLVWQGGTVAYWSSPRELEARFTEAGATCVNEPRMLHPTPLGAATFPAIWSSITAECKIVSCNNLDLADFDGADRMSANPR